MDNNIMPTIIIIIGIIVIAVLVISNLINIDEIDNITSLPGQFIQSIKNVNEPIKNVNEPINQACMIDDIILSRMYDNISNNNNDKIKSIYDKILRNEHTDCDVQKLFKYLDPESRKKIGFDIICDFSDCT